MRTLILLSLLPLVALADYKTRPFCHGTDKVSGVYSDGALRCGTDLRSDGGTEVAIICDGGVSCVADGGTLRVTVTETNYGTVTEDALLVGDGDAVPGQQVLPSCSDPESKLFYNSSTNTFSCGYAYQDGQRRITNICSQGGLTTTLNCTASTAGTTTGVTSSQPTGAIRLYLKASTSTVINNGAGHTSATPAFMLVGGLPRVRGFMFTDSSITDRKFLVGMSSAQINTITHSSGASAVSFVAVGYDTSLGNTWRCCAGDGTNYSCSTMTGGPATDTEYLINVELTSTTSATCRVDTVTGGTSYSLGTPTTITANIPATTTVAMGYTATVTTLVSAVKVAYFGRYVVEYY